MATLFAACNTTPTAPVVYKGINLSGAESGSAIPGTEGSDYIWPTTAQVDYYYGKGMNTFRVNFLWERLQPTAKGELNAVQLNKLKTVVNHATGKGAYVLLNPQNFARYYGQTVGSTAVPNDVFADFWRRLSLEFKDNPKVMFGLVNEPNTMSTSQWRLGAQAAIDAIRLTGATNLITVPGNGWTGMHSWTSDWYGTANGVEMLKITDSKNNFAFEVHQYLDTDFSGTYANGACVSATIGVDKAKPFVAWLRANNRKAILGEFGTPNNALCQTAVNNTLTYLKANEDVVIGWLWWNAIRDNFWGNPYILDLSPKNGVDDPRMSWLAPYLTTPVPAPTVTTPPPAPVVSPTKPAVPVGYVDNTPFTLAVNGITSYVFVPSTYDRTHNTPMKLFVWLHGCGGRSQYDISMVSYMPNQNWISLAVGGREGTCWSSTATDGPKILAAIADLKTHFNVDPRRVVVGGYSSGGDVGYPLLFQNANLFAGGLFENTGPNTTAMTSATTAAWKLNIGHLHHTGDTTYPIAGIRTKMTTLKNAGFPVNLIEKAGTHWDNDNGATGTQYDLRTFLLPLLNAGWTTPLADTVDAGTVDASVPPPPASCVYTYSAWGACQSTGTQSRTVTGSTPTPCTASAQVLSQACTYTPPAVMVPIKMVERVTYNWTSGYCKEFDLVNTNKVGNLTWSEFQLNLRGGTIRDQENKGPPWDTWNAAFSARTGVIKVTAATWNKTLLPGKKATVGFCADFGTAYPTWTATYVVGSLKP